MNAAIETLYRHVGSTLSTDTRSPISSDGSMFDFTFMFPTNQNFRKCEPLMLTMEIEHFPGDGIGLEVQFRRMYGRGVKKLLKFFGTVSKEAEFFLSCYYEYEGSSCMPEGWFYPRHREQGYVVPAYSVMLSEQSHDSQALIEDYKANLYYLCAAAWLIAPILKFMQEKERAPSAPERLRLLSIAHGTAQVLQAVERTKNDPPPSLLFPKGLYPGRWRGDLIRGLRPH